MSEARIYRTLNDTLETNVSYGQLRRAFRDTGALPSTRGSLRVFNPENRAELEQVKPRYRERLRENAQLERARTIGPSLRQMNDRFIDENTTLGYLYRNGLKGETRYNPDGSFVPGTGLDALSTHPVGNLPQAPPRTQFVRDFVDPTTGRSELEIGS